MKATYALPTVVGYGGDGYAWINSRCWDVTDVWGVSVGIQGFLNNIDEFLGEGAKVCRVIKESS